MDKFYGPIGFATTTESAPDVFVEQIVEKKYYGDIVKDYRKLNSPSDQLNRNIDISNRISIVADPFAQANFHTMRYVEYMGSKWKIVDIEVQYPRLILSVGGLYNE